MAALFLSAVLLQLRHKHVVFGGEERHSVSKVAGDSGGPLNEDLQLKSSHLKVELQFLVEINRNML